MAGFKAPSVKLQKRNLTRHPSRGGAATKDRNVLRTKRQLIRLFILLLFSSFAATSFAGENVNLVVNRQSAQIELDLGLARLMFTMRTRVWPDGMRVRVFVLPDRHPLHRVFAKKTLALYPRQLRRVWDRNLFSGTGAVPFEVSSVEEMAEKVAATPGAIGYLPSDMVTADVRIIHVK